MFILAYLVLWWLLGALVLAFGYGYTNRWARLDKKNDLIFKTLSWPIIVLTTIVFVLYTIATGILWYPLKLSFRSGSRLRVFVLKTRRK